MAFLTSYLTEGILFKDDCLNIEVETFDALAQKQINALASLCLLDATFKPFQASQVATAIVYIVRRNLRVTPIWSPSLTALTLHDADEIKAIVRLIDNSSKQLLEGFQINVESDQESEPDFESHIDGSLTPVKESPSINTNYPAGTASYEADKENFELRSSPTSIAISDYTDECKMYLGKMQISVEKQDIADIHASNHVSAKDAGWVTSQLVRF
jgi:hypothetical protein